MLGNGLGSLGAALPFANASSPNDVVLVDLDIDGDLDLVVASTGDNTLRLLLNDGDGGFDEAMQIVTGASPVAIAVGDIDGDELPDIVSADQGVATVTVVLSNA